VAKASSAAHLVVIVWMLARDAEADSAGLRIGASKRRVSH